jgi:hypothetical protein
MSLKILVCLICLALPAEVWGQANKVDREAQEKAAADLRARIEASPKLPFNGVHFTAKPPAMGWESGAVSWVAVDRKGRIYEIQRGDKADAVLMLDRERRVLRSWGKGTSISRTASASILRATYGPWMLVLLPSSSILRLAKSS